MCSHVEQICRRQSGTKNITYGFPAVTLGSNYFFLIVCFVSLVNSCLMFLTDRLPITSLDGVFKKNKTKQKNMSQDCEMFTSDGGKRASHHQYVWVEGAWQKTVRISDFMKKVAKGSLQLDVASCTNTYIYVLFFVFFSPYGLKLISPSWIQLAPGEERRDQRCLISAAW